MRLKEYPIGDYVGKCQTWNPKTSGVGSFDYIDLSSVDKGTKSIVSIERYECSDAPSRARQLVEADDVLVATVRPNLNGVALVNGAHHGMTASTGYCVLRSNKDKLYSRFLFHWVKTGVFVQRMVDVATGANYPAASDAKVKASKIPLPPLAEQKRITRILDAADALRTKRREALAQLDTLLQSTFLDMFGDPVTNLMGWEIEGFDNWLENIDSGWSPKCLNRKALIGEWGVLKLGAVTSCEFDDSDQKALPPSLAPRQELEVAPGDLLFARKNTHDLVAAVAYVHKVRPRLMLSDLIFRLRLKSGIEMKSAFLWQLLIQPKQRQVIQKFAGGSAGSMPNISKAKLKTLKLIKPPLDLQHRFAAIVESVEQQKLSQRTHLADLDTLFASLQSRAFRGDL